MSERKKISTTITITKERTIEVIGNNCSVFCKYYSVMYYDSCNLFNKKLAKENGQSVRCSDCIEQFGT